MSTFDSEVEVKLLPDETADLMMKILAVSTITWYSGDIETVKVPLRQRVCEILLSNPWLAGRIKKNRNGDIVLVHGSSDEAVDNVDSIFRCYDRNEIILNRNETYHSLTQILEPTLVPRSIELVDHNKPIWKVSLIPARSENGDKDVKSFALVTSLAHCAGDGHTYYTIHKMLNLDQPRQRAGESEKQEITVLSTKRKKDIPPQIEKILGGPSTLSKMPLGYIIRFLTGVIKSKLFGPETGAKLFMVDKKWIGEQKAMIQRDKGSDPDAFVSSNDIIASQVFKSADTDQGWIAINFRSKTPNCLNTDAGNYFSNILCSPKDYGSPLTIRKIVREIQDGGRKNYPSMTSWEHMTSKKQHVFCTNWSTFCEPVSMGKNCIQELHMPLLPINFPAQFGSGAIVFRPGIEKDVAVLFLGHPLCLDNLQTSGMIGDDLCQVL